MPLLHDRGPTSSYIKSGAMLVPCMSTYHLGVALHTLAKEHLLSSQSMERGIHALVYWLIVQRCFCGSGAGVFSRACLPGRVQCCGDGNQTERKRPRMQGATAG